MEERGLIDDLVSVITPVFNSERFIEATMRSVQAQTVKTWEMLVLIDDGTRDQTADIVQRFAAEDARIRLIHVQDGRSVTDARNLGFLEARGRWIAFLDADDLWLPEKLEKQLALMRSSGAALSYTGFRRVSVDGADVGREIRVPAELSFTDLLKENRIGCLTAVVDQSQTGVLKMGNDIHEDFVLWLGLLRGRRSAVGVCEDLARYRVVPGSRSSKKMLMAQWRWQVYRAQGLSVVESAYYYVWYALRTVSKHLRF